MQPDISPIFIIGVPRSGTTLLRVLLDSHSQLAAAPETPWITGGYSKQSLREYLAFLMNDKLGPTANLASVSQDVVYAAARNFLSTLFAGYLEEKGKQQLVLNTPDDVEYLDFLTRLYPESAFIHIYRDGRDVACSTINYKDVYFGEKHLREYGDLTYHNALKRWYVWENNIRSILKLDSGVRFTSLAYENLVGEPEEKLKTLCEFLAVKFEPAMLDYAGFTHDYPEWEAGSVDVKQRQGITTSSIGRWRNEVSPEDLLATDRMCGPFLAELGYGASGERLEEQVKDKIIRLENDLRLKTEELNNITGSRLYRWYKVIDPYRVINFLRADNKRLYIADYFRKKWLNRQSHRWRRNQGSAVGVFDLSDQLFGEYGRHRSEWREWLKPLHRADGIYLDTFIEKSFNWHPEGVKPHRQPWVGMIHNPPSVPHWFDHEQSNTMIFARPEFKASIPHCRGMYVFSDYHKRELEKHFDFPINTLFHPTDIPEEKWSWEKFQHNSNKQIVQIGWWLRKLHSIYLLPTTRYTRVHLRKNDANIDKFMAQEVEHEFNGYFPPEKYAGTKVVNYLSNRQYDRLLSENVVFIELYDSSANNTIVECLARHTPLLVNPIPAVVEYLGEDYPLYFNTIEEAAAKADNFDLIRAGYEYLRDNPLQEKLRREYFLESIRQSEIYRQSAGGTE